MKKIIFLSLLITVFLSCGKEKESPDSLRKGEYKESPSKTW